MHTEQEEGRETKPLLQEERNVGNVVLILRNTNTWLLLNAVSGVDNSQTTAAPLTPFMSPLREGVTPYVTDKLDELPSLLLH